MSTAPATSQGALAPNVNPSDPGEPGAIDPSADSAAASAADSATGPNAATTLTALTNLIQPATLNASSANATAIEAAAQTPPTPGAVSGRPEAARKASIQADVASDETLAAPAIKWPGADLARIFAGLAGASSNSGQGSDASGQGAGDALPAPVSGATPSAPTPAQAPLTLALTPTLVDTAAGSALASTYGAAITAQIAAQVTSKAAAGVSAFDFALEPQGLGRVDVSLKINPQGQLSAVLSFDNASAAAEAKGRAADLQQALQQAGFDLSQGGLSFTSGGANGEGAAWRSQSRPAFAWDSPAADAVADPVSAFSAAARQSAGGLDIII